MADELTVLQDTVLMYAEVSVQEAACLLLSMLAVEASPRQTDDSEKSIELISRDILP